MTNQVLMSNYGGNAAWVALLRQPGLYLACHTSSPGVTGSLATEEAGGGYARQPIAFTAPAGRATANSSKAYFSGLVATTVTHLAVWDSPGGGNMIAAMALAPPIVVLQDGQLRVEVGDLAFQL